MLQAFKRYIAQKNLCKSTDKILVAVSGGLDSMVLLHLLRQAGYETGVAHANFQLRGEEADRDEEFVEHYCHRHHLRFYSQRFETKNYATTNGISTQMAARELRYAWFEQLLANEHYHCLATAHHANDLLETMLLNMSKGAGIEGLTGIAAKNKQTIRPLLFATRQQLEDYAAAHQIAWREDESNQADDYQRNFIRHQIVPLLKQINPAMEDAAIRTTSKLHGIQELAGFGLEHWQSANQKKEGDKIVIAKAGLFAFKNPASVLFMLLKQYGFNLDQCDEIFDQLEAQPGKKFSSKQFELVIDRNSLVLYKSFTNEAIAVNLQPSHYQMGSLQLSLRIQDPIAISAERNKAFLDLDKLTFPMLWRKWLPGDAFQPLGMKAKKKLSDFYIDEKLPLSDKESATVIESNGQIAWVVGQREDDRFKITDETKRVLILELRF